jgi:hypothetical protein
VVQPDRNLLQRHGTRSRHSQGPGWKVFRWRDQFSAHALVLAEMTLRARMLHCIMPVPADRVKKFAECAAERRTEPAQEFNTGSA